MICLVGIKRILLFVMPSKKKGGLLHTIRFY